MMGAIEGYFPFDIGFKVTAEAKYMSLQSEDERKKE